MANEIASLSATDDSNVARMPELQAPSTVNNGVRALEGMLARWSRDLMGKGVTVGGTANAITLAINSTTAAAATPEVIGFIAGAANTGALTVNITPSGGAARGTVAVQKSGAALVGGELQAGGFYQIAYDGTQYQLLAAGKRIITAADGAVGAPGLTFNDDLDNGFYRIGANNWAAAVAGAKALEFRDDGSLLSPLQPAVNAFSAGGTDLTGDGTVATLAFASAEDFDLGADFASPTWTCPQTGVYLVAAQAGVFGAGAGHTSIILNAVATVATYRLDYLEHDLNGTYNQLSGMALIKCTAGDTISITLVGAGSTKTIDVDGGRPTRLQIALLG